MSGSVVFYILANSSPNCFAFEYYFYIWYLYRLSDWLKSLRFLAQLVRSNRRHSTGGGFEPPPGRIYPACGKKNPLAVLPLSLAVRHGSWATEPGPCGYGPAHEGYGPAQGQGAASPSPEAGFRGFSRPRSTGLFLIESRGGGLSPAGRVFF